MIREQTHVDLVLYISIPLQVAHRTLDDDEAEERFAQRDKILSRWTQNLSKKLNPDQGTNSSDSFTNLQFRIYEFF